MNTKNYTRTNNTSKANSSAETYNMKNTAKAKSNTTSTHISTPDDITNSHYNTANSSNINNTANSYYLSITDNSTHVVEEMYLTEKEFTILDTAIRHNRGIVNLLSDSNKETINGLFNKGLITISKDKLELPVVSDVISCILDPNIRKDFTEDILLEENRPNGFFKLFGNKSICFCCL